MEIVFVALVIISSILLGLIVLIQNPKGGGLSGTFGGVSNQFMGVKQTTDVLEKGTWIFAAAVAILCLISPAFIPKKSSSATEEQLRNMPTNSRSVQPTQPQQPATNNVQPAPGPSPDSIKN